MTLAELRRTYERRRVWLRRYLRDEGLSQSEFARMVGVSPSTISRIIAGREPSFSVWLAILEAAQLE